MNGGCAPCVVPPRGEETCSKTGVFTHTHHKTPPPTLPALRPASCRTPLLQMPHSVPHAWHNVRPLHQHMRHRAVDKPALTTGEATSLALGTDAAQKPAMCNHHHVLAWVLCGKLLQCLKCSLLKCGDGLHACRCLRRVVSVLNGNQCSWAARWQVVPPQALCLAQRTLSQALQWWPCLWERTSCNHNMYTTAVVQHTCTVLGSACIMACMVCCARRRSEA